MSSDVLVAIAYVMLAVGGLRLLLGGSLALPWLAGLVSVVTGVVIADWWVPLLALPAGMLSLLLEPRDGRDGEDWVATVRTGVAVNAVLLAIGAGIGAAIA